MPKQAPFPSKEADLNLYFQTVGSYLIIHVVRLNYATINKTEATEVVALWMKIFPVSQNKNIQTKRILENKNAVIINLMYIL